jgi:hypothetical protein
MLSMFEVGDVDELIEEESERSLLIDQARYYWTMLSLPLINKQEQQQPPRLYRTRWREWQQQQQQSLWWLWWLAMAEYSTKTAEFTR